MGGFHGIVTKTKRSSKNVRASGGDDPQRSAAGLAGREIDQTVADFVDCSISAASDHQFSIERGGEGYTVATSICFYDLEIKLGA